MQLTLGAISAAAAEVAAASASGGTKGLQVGTRSSSRLCAKKQICRRHLVPSLHNCVRYLQAGNSRYNRKATDDSIVSTEYN